MDSSSLFSAGDFAKMARVSRDTLHYYDKIGLIHPISRGENKYRYYSSRQLAVINVIRTLQELGMSLAEIKEMKDNRQPSTTEDAFAEQLEKINDKIDNLTRKRQLLLTLRKAIHSGRNVKEDEITIQFMPAEPIILGESNDYVGGQDDYDALLHFYNAMQLEQPDLDLNYPVWGVFSAERIRRRDWTFPDQYYFYNPEGADERPAALYAVGYARCNYGKGRELYAQMMDYIDENGFEVCGNTYEEYPLNEVCMSDYTNYLMRVMITVREKEPK